MRRETAHWIFAYVAVALSAGLAAWAGVKASDPTSYVDAAIKGAVMFMIAVLGCHGWAWAARTWSNGHKAWATIAGIVLTVAMVVTLIGGAGSFYGTASEKQGTAQRGTDAYVRADAELKRIEKKIKKLTRHRTVGEIEPDIETAKTDRRYKVTQGCAPEHTTRSADFCKEYRKLEQEKAAADEHERLDKLRAPHLAVVSKGRPTAAGGWGALLAALFGVSVELGNALFSTMCTIALDMGAVVAVLTAELRDPNGHQPERPKEPKNDMRPLDRLLSRWRRRPQELQTNETTEIVVEPGPARIEPLPRPRLVVNGGARSAGSIPKILSSALEPAKGSRVEMEEVYAAYAGECGHLNVHAVSPEEFVDPLERFCTTCRIRTKVADGKVFLLDVRLTSPAMATQEEGA